MSVLVFTPSWIQEGVEAIHPKCRASVESQQIATDWQWVVALDNPYPIPDYRNVLQKYQRAQAMVLNGKWDALLTVEHDNVLPDEEAVQRLLETPGDIVYAPYLLRHGTPVLNTFQYVGRRNLGMSLSNYPDELRQARAAVVHRISGAGMGCTLFRRQVLEAIEFDVSSPINACPDMGFATTALRAGFISVGRFDVPVAHYHQGRWLIPFEEEISMNYIARETGQAAVNGRMIRMKSGQPLALSEEEAKALASLGKIDEVEDPVDQESSTEEESPSTSETLVVDVSTDPLENLARQGASRRNKQKN